MQPIRVSIVEVDQPIRSRENLKCCGQFNDRTLIGQNPKREEKSGLSRKAQHWIFRLRD